MSEKIILTLNDYDKQCGVTFFHFENENKIKNKWKFVGHWDGFGIKNGINSQGYLMLPCKGIIKKYFEGVYIEHTDFDRRTIRQIWDIIQDLEFKEIVENDVETYVKDKNNM
jgi:hypothetical protein